MHRRPNAAGVSPRAVNAGRRALPSASALHSRDHCRLERALVGEVSRHPHAGSSVNGPVEANSRVVIPVARCLFLLRIFDATSYQLAPVSGRRRWPRGLTASHASRNWKTNDRPTENAGTYFS